MNSDSPMPSSIVDAQVQRLLEIVAEFRQQQCDALLEEAQSRARRIIRQAYRNARTRLHRDIQESRQNMKQEVSATRAKQHTFMMQQRHRDDQEFLDKSWALLAEQLQQRWRDTKQRQLWIQHVTETALQVLPGQQWQVSCPSDWSTKEQDKFKQSVLEKSNRDIAITSNTDISAGIKISADAALVDGTINGLLADRGRIESEMLAHRHRIQTSKEKESSQ